MDTLKREQRTIVWEKTWKDSVESSKRGEFYDENDAKMGFLYQKKKGFVDRE